MVDEPDGVTSLPLVLLQIGGYPALQLFSLRTPPQTFRDMIPLAKESLSPRRLSDSTSNLITVSTCASAVPVRKDAGVS
jgi:hypothetical protein